MSNRINLDDSLYPIEGFFNSVSNGAFVKVINSLSHGIGFGANDCICTFPGDLDPWETPFEGVKFSLFEKSVIITKSSLFDIVKLACDEFTKQNPEKRVEIEEILERFMGSNSDD